LIKDKVIVDAMSILRFVNDSKEPNIVPKIMTVNDSDKRICLYALKDIEKDDELFFDYGWSKKNQKKYFNKSEPQ